jgi:hypothetical protein
MTTENKLSLTLTLLLIAIALTIAVVGRASSPATDPRSYYLCGTLHECAVG